MSNFVHFFSFAGNWSEAVLFIVRIITAVIFASHGWFKSFGKQKFRGSADRFAERGIPFPLFLSYVTSLSQLIAVPLLVLGFLTQWIVLILAMEMLVAVWAKYMDTHAIFDGMDLPLSDLAICMMLFVLGPGAFSIDALIRM
ncbi:DoxX family protein [Desulfosporosinus fructosivorans]|uniref:DoxX family protein n=1 Tax=Desulfosporosinus fructosivorans TaxID=2018669 RepID=A0A4Z0R7M9_9FIRM|nr:DoxX family protein [Desulfosporosinus fructosivorans]TGE39112.1 DoxX family protein [Desulfosporosinus fructosivorans]